MNDEIIQTEKELTTKAEAIEETHAADIDITVPSHQEFVEKLMQELPEKSIVEMTPPKDLNTFNEVKQELLKKSNEQLKDLLDKEIFYIESSIKDSAKKEAYAFQLQYFPILSGVELYTSIIAYLSVKFYRVYIIENTNTVLVIPHSLSANREQQILVENSSSGKIERAATILFLAGVFLMLTNISLPISASIAIVMPIGRFLGLSAIIISLFMAIQVYKEAAYYKKRVQKYSFLGGII